MLSLHQHLQLIKTVQNINIAKTKSCFDTLQYNRVWNALNQPLNTLALVAQEHTNMIIAESIHYQIN